MVHSVRVQARRNARVDHILDGATALIDQEGLEALTLQRVAQSVELATTALYRYFSSKAELVAALEGRAVAVVADELAQAERASPSPLARILAAAQTVWRLPARHPAHFGLVDGLLSGKRAEAPGPVDRALAPVFSGLERLFKQAHEAGALAPGDTATQTRLMWGLLHGLQHIARSDGAAKKTRRAEPLFRAGVSSLLVGFGASPSGVAAAWDQLDARRRR